jgi:hypothetical protein
MMSVSFFETVNAGYTDQNNGTDYSDRQVRTRTKKLSMSKYLLMVTGSLRGPCKWVRDIAIPRYPSYPVSGGIVGQPCVQGV